MIIYYIDIYITKGNTQEIKKTMPAHLRYGIDFSVIKRKATEPLFPEPILTTKDVRILIYKRNCKIDYLPLAYESNIGEEKHHELSFLISIEPNELPQKLYNMYRFYLYQIDKLINTPFCICSKCKHNNKYCAGPCSLCGNRTVPVK